ncbi:hypothetical protein QAD02_022990 [Eretmocerus hayati]|uniref:Uncharacterized protein n=1 Tax=Eretmocerus hayati TaxID=131215 RepID=A0ACC2PW85_9HYME|nr:hypothetical protein QAD02_022990 [Eretmocerus hayati]
MFSLIRRLTTFVLCSKPYWVENDGIRQILQLQNLTGTAKVFVRFETSLVPSRVLVLTKISRYQIEKFANPDLDEAEFKSKLLTKGVNYDAILATHLRNKSTKSRIIKTLEKLNITYQVKDRRNIDLNSITWADLVVPVGGDGTFLLAANLICDNTKPIVGINSDPEFSEGFLMLPSKYTNDIDEVFERLKAGQYHFLMRSRIRTTLHGDNIWQAPFHMHENDFSDCNQNKFYVNHHNSTVPSENLPKTRRLPWLALNEVFIGESLSARISILHIDNGSKDIQKTKSSGLCVTTGTGSSSWYRTINSLDSQTFQNVLSMINHKENYTEEDIQKFCFEFNSRLQFPAERLELSYVIRDMIVKHAWPPPRKMDSCGSCQKLNVRSLCSDGGLVIDGGIAVHFNIGTSAILETVAEDALRNIVLPD